MAELINMPKLGFDMAEGTLVHWLKKEGQTVAKGEVLAEIETDKATVEVESSASGVVRKLLVDEGTVVPINTPIAVVGTAEEKIEPASASDQPSPVSIASAGIPDPSTVSKQRLKTATETEAVSSRVEAPLKASPLAKKIARDRSVDLGQVQGTGPGGRIVRRDIDAILQIIVAEPPNLDGTPSIRLHRPVSSLDEMVPLSRLRQAIARRMTEAKTSIPHFYVTHEYKMDALMELRTQFNKLAPESDKVSVNDFIIKAVALSLRQFPNLNSSFQAEKLLQHGQVNVGVAVSVDNGLLTIVCKKADTKPLRQIALEVKAMAAKARAGKVRPEEIEGSTFSISNLGMYDIENFIAIINPPETAILAVGSARQVPVVAGSERACPELGIGWRMKATISVDHRVSDGVEAARFMQALAVYLEEPLRLVV